MHHNLARALAVSSVLLWFGSEVRANVVFSLGEAIAVPGETDVVIPLSIEREQTDEQVTGLQLSLTYDPDVLGAATLEVMGGYEIFRVLEPWDYSDAGHIGLLIPYDVNPEFRTAPGVFGVSPTYAFACRAQRPPVSILSS